MGMGESMGQSLFFSRMRRNSKVRAQGSLRTSRLEVRVRRMKARWQRDCRGSGRSCKQEAEPLRGWWFLVAVILADTSALRRPEGRHRAV